MLARMLIRTDSKVTARITGEFKTLVVGIVLCWCVINY